MDLSFLGLTHERLDRIAQLVGRQLPGRSSSPPASGSIVLTYGQLDQIAQLVSQRLPGGSSSPPTNGSIVLTYEQLDQIAQLVGQRLLNVHRVWGDPKRVSMGKEVFVMNALFNCSSGNISIGDYTFFGHNVCLLTGTHDFRKKRKERFPWPEEGRDIKIGEGVWIASNVTVLGPCTIGDHAVIGGGSVVCGGNLPGSFLYAGFPAKSIKPIDFHQETLSDCTPPPPLFRRNSHARMGRRHSALALSPVYGRGLLKQTMMVRTSSPPWVGKPRQSTLTVIPVKAGMTG
jgi:acetyltransferase-like isoleucine patch superfamily enzyme